MNEWVEKSVKIAKGDCYLDNLLNIYSFEEAERKLKIEDFSPNLKNLFVEKKNIELFKELIHLKKCGFKFPFENSFISFFSVCEEAVEKNPKTINKICDILYKMDYETLKQNIEAPKKASRRMSLNFSKWLRNNYNFLNIYEFQKTNKKSFLDAGDIFLKKYAQEQLKCVFNTLSKGLDFIIKIKDNYFLGTTKFLTDFGGSQDNQFYEALRFLKETKTPENVKKIAIIDGVFWLNEKKYNNLFELKDNNYCFSALLLNDFLNNF